METFAYSGLRVMVRSSKSFEEVTEAIRSLAGKADSARFEKLVRSGASPQQVAEAVAAMEGKSGFMIFAEIPEGPLLSLLGIPRKAALFVLGNPLIANRIFDHDLAAGLYVPLRLYIFSDPDGKTCIEYDKPSSLLDQFKNGAALAIANMLDEKLDKLTAEAASTA